MANRFIRWPLAGLVLMMLAACGGGGGSSTSIDAAVAAAAGVLTLSFSDAPIDDYDQVLMDVEQIRLIADGGQDIAVLSQPVTVDLLALRNFSEVLLSREVTAGTYSKIRLILGGLRLVRLDGDGNVAQSDTVRLNGLQKVDVNPRRPFTISGGQELLIDLDVDLEKSIHVVSAGASGQIRFRPVVFASVISRSADQKLYRVEGTVDALLGGDAFRVCDIRRASTDVSGTPQPADVCVDVGPTASTPYFDFEGNPYTTSIAVNDRVVVYGKFPTATALVPAVVAVGSPFTVAKGVAGSEFRAATGDFDLGSGGTAVAGCLSGDPLLRVELAEGAPAFVESPGTADQAASAAEGDLALLPLLCRNAEAEGYLDETAEPFLKAFILMFGDSQAGVTEYAGALTEKVDATDDVPYDYDLAVDAQGAPTDVVVAVPASARVVVLTDGVNQGEIVTTEGTRTDLPIGAATDQVVVYGTIDGADVLNATFVMIDRTAAGV